MSASFLASIEAVNSAYIAAPNNNSKTGLAGGGTSIDTTGATMLCAIIRANSANPLLTDSASNTWQLSSTFTSGGVARIRVAWVFNPITSTTHSFNPTPNPNEASCDVFAFTGAGSWSQVNIAGATTNTSGTSVTTGSIGTSSGDVVLAGLCSNASISSGTVNNGFDGGIAGQPFGTALAQRLSGTPELGMGAYLISGGGSINAKFTTSASNGDWIWAICSFTLLPPAASRGVVFNIWE
jgi:hypothetical protein